MISCDIHIGSVHITVITCMYMCMYCRSEVICFSTYAYTAIETESGLTGLCGGNVN